MAVLHGFVGLLDNFSEGRVSLDDRSVGRFADRLVGLHAFFASGLLGVFVFGFGSLGPGSGRSFHGRLDFRGFGSGLAGVLVLFHIFGRNARDAEATFAFTFAFAFTLRGIGLFGVTSWGVGSHKASGRDEGEEEREFEFHGSVLGFIN